MDSYIAQRALILKRTLGTRTAAGFLRNKGISIGSALELLCGRRNVKLLNAVQMAEALALAGMF